MTRFAVSVILGVVLGSLLLFAGKSMFGGGENAQVPQAIVPHQPPTQFDTLNPELADWSEAMKRSKRAGIDYLEQFELREVEGLLKKLDPKQDLIFACMAFDRIAEIDRESALGLAQATWDFQGRIPVISKAILRWAGEDFDDCSDWLHGMGQGLDESERNNPLWKKLLKDTLDTRSLAKPSETEVENAWAELRRSAAGIGETGQKLIAVNDGVFEDPQTGMPVGSMWSLINAAVENGGWSATLEQVIELPGGCTPLYIDLIHKWVETDPDGAAEWYIRQGKGRERTLFSASMGSGQFRSIGAEIHHDRRSFCRKMVEDSPNDPDLWVEFANHSPREVASRFPEIEAGTAELDAIRRMLCISLRAHDIESSLAWGLSITRESLRDQMVHDFVRFWNQEEPWEAKRWAMENLGWSAEKCAEMFRFE